MPEPDDIVITASVATADLLDGTQLHDLWQNIVNATHPDYSQFSDLRINPQVFLPLDPKKFMYVRLRSVSALEKHGPNSNGDGFPADELIKSFATLIGKGFYEEHNSFNPGNAIGVNVHAEWVADQMFVESVAAIDKIRFPRKADMWRDLLASKRAGVSIGCIAGEAQCSVCGNIARKAHQLCGHMNRLHPHYVKGRMIRKAGSQGEHIAHDICRMIYFYEQSGTKLPADHDAFSKVIMGSTHRLAADAPVPEVEVEDPKPSKGAVSISSPIPTDEVVKSWTEKATHDALITRFKKLVKDEVYKALEPEIRDLQSDLRPVVQEIVKEKKQQLQDAEPQPVQPGGEKPR